jgi:hypothetical protein
MSNVADGMRAFSFLDFEDGRTHGRVRQMAVGTQEDSADSVSSGLALQQRMLGRAQSDGWPTPASFRHM